MLIAVLLITAGLGLRGYLIAQIASAAFVCLMLLIAVRKFTPVEARFSALPGSSPNREIWSFSAAMLGIGFMEFGMNQVDKVALGFYRSPREVGIYSIAGALVVYVPLVLSSINQIFAPTIADLAYARRSRFAGPLISVAYEVGRRTYPPARSGNHYFRPPANAHFWA